MQFYKALKFTLQNEGGYSDSKYDKGGKTKFGISQRQYPDLDIPNLTMDQAQEIYLRDYWNKNYNNINQKLAIRLFDLGVNCGVKRSIIMLQESLNNYFGKNLKIDGIFGNKTLKSINEVNQNSLYSALILTATLYYVSLNQPQFLIGWLNRLYKRI